MDPPPLPAKVGSARWVASLAGLTGIIALSIDMSLPAQPALTRTFHVSPGASQLTLSLFLVGYGCGYLVVGALADVRGRRPVLLEGLAVFTLAGLGCALSPGLPLLLVGRLVQGLGAAAGAVVARAMVRDTHDPIHAARTLSLMTAMLAIAPLVAPLAGAFLLDRLGWRSIYAALALIGIVFLLLSALTLPETQPPERRRAFSAAAMARGFALFFRTPGTLVPTALLCASFAGQFAYISSSPFVLMQGYGVSASGYALCFGASALALMVGSFGGSRLLRAKAVPTRLVGLGAAGLCLGGLSLALSMRIAPGALLGFMGPILVYFLGLGLVGPSAISLAMAPVPEIAGTASAVIGFGPMIAGATSGWVTTRFGGQDPRALSWVMAGVGAIAALLAARLGRR